MLGLRGRQCPAPQHPARRRDDIPHVFPRQAAQKAHGILDTVASRQLLQARLVPTFADDGERRPRHCIAHRRPALDQPVLPLARHEPGSDHDQGGRPEFVAVACRRPLLARCGREEVRVYTRGQRHECDTFTECGAKTTERVLRDIRDRIRRIADQTEHLTRSRQHRPPHFVSVRRGHDCACTSSPGSWSHHSQWRSRTEPDRGDAVLFNQFLHAAHRRRSRQHHFRGQAVDGVRQRSVVKRCFMRILRGGEDDERLRPTQAHEFAREIPQIRLNPADCGREIIRDEKRCHAAQ